MDLHVHTCLSPCADSAMLPTAMVRQAKMKNLDGIGICDHNSTENVSAVKKAGEREGLQVFGGLEITSSEEVHILAFFDDDAALNEIQGIVNKNLTGENDEKYFGEQVIVDEDDRVIGSSKRMLIGATGLSVDAVVRSIRGLGGLAIASHIDREGFGIIGQLGFIPKDLPLDALEISTRAGKDKSEFAIHGFPLVTFSDAHYLQDIGKAVTCFVLEKATVDEISRALKGKDGRSVRWE